MSTRIARVSAIDYENGKISVVYKDKDNTVSKFLSCLALEYNMPNINDLVIVQTIDNSVDGSGIILGKIYNKENKPKDGKKDIYRKDISDNCYIEYNKATNNMLIWCNGEITVKCKKINEVKI